MPSLGRPAKRVARSVGKKPARPALQKQGRARPSARTKAKPSIRKAGKVSRGINKRIGKKTLGRSVRRKR